MRLLETWISMLAPWCCSWVLCLGGSSSRTASNTTYNTETNNLNLQGLEGVTVAGNEGDVAVSVTDQGAVREAFDFGTQAVDAVSRASDGVLSGAFQFARESLGLVERSASAAQRTFEDSLAATLATADAERTGGSERLVQLGGLALAAMLLFALVLRKA